MPDETRREITDYLGRRLTRRQAIKAGGLTAMGLAFSKPIIETIRPIPAFASYPGGGDPPPPACPESFTDFSGFTIGISVNGQGGWSAASKYDENVADDNGNTVLRISNAVTAGSFSDMPFAPRPGGIPTNTTTDPVNSNPQVFAGESSTGAAHREFTAAFDFKSATGLPQPGLRITVSADSGNGGRQSFVAIEDTGTGLLVTTDEYNAATSTFTGPIPIATGLSYSDWHTVGMKIEFVDGSDNDVVRYYVNGTLVHTGPSWEEFYRDHQAGLHPLGVPVQSLIFRLSGTAQPGVAGNGFFIDNVLVSPCA